MASDSPPSTMRAWQYSSISEGIEKGLELKTVPLPVPKPNQHLVRVLSVGLNPVDYKPAEVTIFRHLVIPNPATPGVDFAGRIVKAAPGSDLKAGQLVFGSSSTSPFAGGALAEYAAVPSASVVTIPTGLSVVEAGGMPVAVLTAWQSLMDYIKPGSRVFLNGGSGGVGTYAIQIAKQAGAHVTASCSTANVELCKSLGADDVVDYKQEGVVLQLQSLARTTGPFDHVVDLVGSDFDLYWKAHTYAAPGAKYVLVAASPKPATVLFMVKAALLPGFLGGGKRKLTSMVAKPNNEQLWQVAQWVVEGKFKAVLDQKFAFEDAVKAFERQKTGRSRGKVVVLAKGE